MPWQLILLNMPLVIIKDRKHYTDREQIQSSIFDETKEVLSNQPISRQVPHWQSYASAQAAVGIQVIFKVRGLASLPAPVHQSIVVAAANI
jgi:hypothetical protein